MNTQEYIEIAGLRARMGEKVQGEFTLGGEFTMPGCLIRGAKEGKTMLITAGIHAGEYNGIETLTQMAEQISAKDVRGTLMLVKVVAREAFENRTGSLIDGKENLNRVFPGKINGTKAERLAFHLNREMIAKADYYIDLHGGDIFENLTPYVYYAGKADEAVVAKSRDMAKIVDVPYMVKSNVSMGGAYNYAATTGVPSILIERGGMGRCDIEAVGSMRKDVLNILNYLDFYDTDWERQSHYPLDVEDITYQYAEHFGLWQPTKQPGDLIGAGELIGTVTDYDNRVIERAIAQYDAVILYQTESLQVTENGPMIAYGKIVQEGDQRKERIKNYWGKRSESFLVQRRHELHDPISDRWMREIFKYFPKDRKLNILDVGCGAGYFSILLAKEGHTCTGIDLTPEMIDAANVLAKEEGVDCTFAVMDAEHPDFPEGSFDCIICRNLVWTLPHPEEAYHSWSKLVKKGGLMLIFDADYGKDNNSDRVTLPKNHAHNMIGNDMMVENELIKQSLPISSYSRPAWDLDALGRQCVDTVTVDLQAGKKIYKKIDEFYNPVPVFAICAKTEE